MSVYFCMQKGGLKYTECTNGGTFCGGRCDPSCMLALCFSPLFTEDAYLLQSSPLPSIMATDHQNSSESTTTGKDKSSWLPGQIQSILENSR